MSTIINHVLNRPVVGGANEQGTGSGAEGADVAMNADGTPNLGTIGSLILESHQRTALLRQQILERREAERASGNHGNNAELDEALRAATSNLESLNQLVAVLGVVAPEATAAMTGGTSGANNLAITDGVNNGASSSSGSSSSSSASASASASASMSVGLSSALPSGANTVENSTQEMAMDFLGLGANQPTIEVQPQEADTFQTPQIVQPAPSVVANASANTTPQFTVYGAPVPPVHPLLNNDVVEGLNSNINAIGNASAADSNRSNSNQPVAPAPGTGNDAMEVDSTPNINNVSIIDTSMTPNVNDASGIAQTPNVGTSATTGDALRANTVTPSQQTAHHTY